MTPYSLTINNNSGAAQNIAVFQVDDTGAGQSLIWLVQTISNSNHSFFTWETNWGLSWGTTSQPLEPGIIYFSGSAPTDIQPDQANGINLLPITYNNGDFKSGKAYHDSTLSLGDMRITTDKTFTVEESLNMSVAVYMSNQPVWAAQGLPNSEYNFNTKTSYYLTVTDYEAGAAIPNDLSNTFVISNPNASVISNPTQVQFPSGITQLTYSLNDILEFEQV